MTPQFGVVWEEDYRLKLGMNFFTFRSSLDSAAVLRQVLDADSSSRRWVPGSRELPTGPSSSRLRAQGARRAHSPRCLLSTIRASLMSRRPDSPACWRTCARCSAALRGTSRQTPRGQPWWPQSPRRSLHIWVDGRSGGWERMRHGRGTKKYGDKTVDS